jgi:hypothetical protein
MMQQPPTYGKQLFFPGVRYALKSRSSNCYLDGRQHDGEMAIMNSQNPNSNQQLHWELQDCDEGYISIKSVSSGGYLDGRNESIVECLVTKRNPHNDKHLNWKIEECEGYLTFKCKANGHYLDGRAQHGHVAFATGRQP